MKKIWITLLVMAIGGHLSSQVTKVEELSEVVVTAVNYKYLNKLDHKKAAVPVKMLQRKAAAYDVSSKDYYEDDYDFYTVSFVIPDGKIVAEYDPQGEIIRTIERFEGVKLPYSVSEAIMERFPNWEIVKDIYIVSYRDGRSANGTYKITLENGDKSMKVKINEEGDFL